MKRINFVIIIVLFILLFSSCDGGLNKEGKNVNSNLIKEIHGYKVDNNTDVDIACSNSYSLDSLENYFSKGTRRIQFNSFFEDKNSEYFLEKNNEEITLKKALKKFSSVCLRENGENYYTVYNIKEGGRYYVFWDNDTSDTKDILRVIDSFYLNDLKSISDYECVKEGKSTYEDVYKMDKFTEINLITSSVAHSFNILNTGEVLHIVYDYGEGSFTKRV